MTRSLAILCLLVAAGLPVPCPVARAQEVPTGRIDDLMNESLDRWHVPGASLVIVHGDRVLHIKGYGVRELGKPDPVTPATVFPLASCTKAFTTAALAALVDDGKLDWDDPVRRRLDSFHLADPLADAECTLRDLVCHRTGLAGHDLLWYGAPWGEEEAVRRLARLRPSRSFRSGFQYQSICFNAAGLAVARTAGVSWSDFVRARLLRPLGMTATCFTTAEALAAADHASPHRAGADGRVRGIPWYRIEKPNSAGSLHSTAEDLANWLRFQLNAGKFRGTPVVAARTLVETHRPQTIIRLEGTAEAMSPDTMQLSYGLGWVVQDHRGELVVSHAGAIDGFRAQVTLLPARRLGFALLNNLHETRMNLAVSNSLIDLLLRFPPRDWTGYFLELTRQEELARDAARADLARQRHPDTRPSLPLAEYAGEYEEPAYGRCRIVLETAGAGARDGLVWEWAGHRCPLEHYHFDTFTAVDEQMRSPQLLFRLTAPGSVGGFRAFDLEFTRVEKAASPRPAR